MNETETIPRAWVLQLYHDYEDICYTYDLHLTCPIVEIRSMHRMWGCWDASLRVISISLELVKSYSWATVLDIFKHEIAHQLVDEVYRDGGGHGAAFQQACERLAVPLWARRATVQPEFDIEQLRNEDLGVRDRSLIRKVKGLLALAGSDNEHESLAAMKKVQALYRRHRIEHLVDHDLDGFDVLTISHGKKRIPYYQVKIGSILAMHFGVRVIYNSMFDSKRETSVRVMELLGTKSGLQIAEYVYYYLFQQLPSLWKASSCTHVRSTVMRRRGRVDRSSFYEGVLQGFSEQLEASGHSNIDVNMAAVSQYNNEVALLRQADRQLDQFFAQRFPKVESVGRRSRQISRSFYNEGREEGRKLKFRRAVSSGQGGIRGRLGAAMA